MFNLIISIIAIALVVALAAATLYYGGDAFNKGSEQAKAATFVNQAQQIQAAVTLSTATGNSAADIDDLVSTKYLSGVPKIAAGGVGEWEINGGYAQVPVKIGTATDSATITKGVCGEIIKSGAGLVLCGSAAGTPYTAETLEALAPTSIAPVDAFIYMAL